MSLQDYWIAFVGGLLLSLPAAWFAYRSGLLFRSIAERTSPIPISWVNVFTAYFLVLLSQLLLAPFFLSLIARVDRAESFSQLLQSPYWMGVGHLIGISLSLFLLIFYLLVLPPSVKLTMLNPSWKNGRQCWQSFGKGVLSWLFVYPMVVTVNAGIALLIQFLVPHAPVEQNVIQSLKEIQVYPYLFFAMALAIFTLVPLLEEILFRGFLQNWIHRCFGRNFAILLTSIIFAFFHFSFSQQWQNIELLGSIFVLSLFLGYLYEQEGTLLAPIGLHAIFNAVTFLFVLLGIQDF